MRTEEGPAGPGFHAQGGTLCQLAVSALYVLGLHYTVGR